MKKSYIILIISLFILLFLPVVYYFCYALPQHNKELQKVEKDKLEYQKEVDRLDREREEKILEQEKKDKELKEIQEQDRIKKEKEENEQAYNDCIDVANKWREDNFDRYCELSYKTCVNNIKERWNGFVPSQQSYAECDKYKIDQDGNCYILDNYAQERKEGYDRQLEMCDRYL